MNKKALLKLLIIIILILQSIISIFCESKIIDERRFQLGFGFILGTHSIAGISETNRINDAAKNDCDYYFPLASDKEEKFEALNKDQKNGMLAGHLLGGWSMDFNLEYYGRYILLKLI